MALGFVVLGIITGVAAAALALASEAGFLIAVAAYAGGGMAGMLGAVLFAFRPQHGVMTALPQTE